MLPTIGKNNKNEQKRQQDLADYQEKISKLADKFMNEFEAEQLNWIDVINVCNFILKRIEMNAQELNLNYIREAKGKEQDNAKPKTK